ncbi:MAG TPA: lipopolysaccharide biosynthesis protein [Beijerinckiaceae bacterium]|nr:lipopolysaccharide biosynthesis protein [Beijerinckiaceae bacterium]
MSETARELETRGLLQRALGLLRDRALIGSIAALSIKGVGALLGFVVFTAAARSMGPGPFGTLAIWYNALSFFAVTAIFGQDILVVRSWGEYVGHKQFGLAHGAYLFGWRITIVSALACGLALWIAGSFRGPDVTAASVAAACAYLMAQILLHYSSHTCRSIVGFAVSESNRELTARIILAATVLLVARQGLTLAEFFAAAAGGIGVAVVVQCLAVRRRFPQSVAAAAPQMLLGNWFARSRSMWVSAVTEAASQYAEVVLIGLFTSPAVAAEYFIATRIANVFPMLATGLHSYSMSHAANLFFAGKLDALQSMIRSVMRVAALMMTPLFVAVIFFARPILLVFGHTYTAGTGAVIILSTACFIIAMSGPSAGILLTTGFEKIYSRALVAALAVRFGLIVFLAQRYGAPGAAAGWALVNIPLSIGLAALCRRRRAIDPSVMAILPNRHSRSGGAVA